ncbi:UNVERIFIED_CONTAM: hypothetical protein RMT77_006413 [Armadillidium vulgare]
MKESFLIILCLTFIFSASFTSETNVEEKKPTMSEISLVEKNKEIGERLSRQLEWFEPAKIIFSNAKKGKESQPDLNNEGRFLKVIHSKGGSMSQLDMLFQILTTAAKDFCDILRVIADKYEKYVIDDETNLLAIRAGRARLLAVIRDFQATALAQARAAAATALASAGGGGGLLGGLLGGGGGGVGGLLSGLLGGLGGGRK